MKKTDGFTLVEVLIAVSILSVLLFTGSYLYSTLSTRWDKELGEFSSSMNKAKSTGFLQQVLEGCMPWIVTTTTENYVIPAFFFVGAEQSLLGITRSGLFDANHPEIFRLTAVQQEDNSYELIYQAVSSNDVFLVNTDQEIIFEHELVILKDLESVKFNYFGFENFDHRSRANDDLQPTEPQWFDEYSGIGRKIMPEQVRLEIQQADRFAEFEVAIDAKSTRFMTHYLEQQTDI